MNIIKLLIFFLVLNTLYLILNTPIAHAASLASVSATLSTSRPSASSPLAFDQYNTATQSASVIDNGSIYLASDAALLRPDTGETSNSLTVASMSAQQTGTPNSRIVYFTNIISNTHHKGDALVVPITAMHTVMFVNSNQIPISGRIIITYPGIVTGDANTGASPSASTFQLNSLSSFKIFDNGLDISSGTTLSIVNPTSAGTNPTVNLTFNASTSVPAGHIVKIYLGCSGATSLVCSTQVPTIINPTKTAAAGTSDNWQLSITTRDMTNGIDIDTAKIRIATIDSVQVQGTVEPSLTFSIAAVANSTAVNAANAGCSNSETTNSGFASTATVVNLGIIPITTYTLSAQTLTVVTNASNGYAVTATSSGHLQNDATGVQIGDPGPNNFATWQAPSSSVTQFGIHACGADVNTTNWGAASTSISANTAKIAWPSTVNNVTLASTGVGPIPKTGTTGSGITTVEYASSVANTVPPGTYQAIITYVATATF